MSSRGIRAVSAALASALSLLSTTPARAIDPFEIQVYDGTSNAPGELSLEAHVNRVFRGVKEAAPPELPPDRQSHLTFEPALGLTTFWEVGAYFQTALLADGTPAYAGVKLRNLFIVPRIGPEELHLGANFELSRVPEKFDRERWGVEIRPIAAWAGKYVFASVNPIVGIGPTQPTWGDGPGFQPSAALYARLPGRLDLGGEYYADLGPFAHPLPRSQQLQYLYAAGNWVVSDSFDVNFGLGFGLTEASNPIVAKIILGTRLGALWGG